MKNVLYFFTIARIPCLQLCFTLLFLPTVSVAQWSLNLGYAAEINHFTQLNALIDGNNQLNSHTESDNLGHLGLMTGSSIAIAKDVQPFQWSLHYNRLKETVRNDNALPQHRQIALSYANTQLGLGVEWQFCSFLSVGSTLDGNFLNINRSLKKEGNYYTASRNIFSKGYGSQRYYLHFQKALNPYFVVGFRPYYQQSFKVVDFSSIREVLADVGTPIATVTATFKGTVAPQRWTNWGGEILLKMFLSSKE